MISLYFVWFEFNVLLYHYYNKHFKFYGIVTWFSMLKLYMVKSFHAELHVKSRNTTSKFNKGDTNHFKKGCICE